MIKILKPIIIYKNLNLLLFVNIYQNYNFVKPIIICKKSKPIIIYKNLKPIIIWKNLNLLLFVKNLNLLLFVKN